MDKSHLEPELLVNDAAGIYIPQEFAKTYDIKENFANYDEIKDLIKELQEENSIDNEHYYDIYQDLIDKAILFMNDSKYYLYPGDGGLWAVPEGYDNEEFFF